MPDILPAIFALEDAAETADAMVEHFTTEGDAPEVLKQSGIAESCRAAIKVLEASRV